MKKLLFILILIVASKMQAQTTLDERVTLLKSADFNIKLKAAMQQVAIGILTTPLSADSTAAAAQTLKKSFAKGIIEQGGDRYIFPVIASGQVSDASSDVAILGAIAQMFEYFAAFKQGQ